jgi:hypothetical protein
LLRATERKPAAGLIENRDATCPLPFVAPLDWLSKADRRVVWSSASRRPTSCGWGVCTVQRRRVRRAHAVPTELPGKLRLSADLPGFFCCCRTAGLPGKFLLLAGVYSYCFWAYKRCRVSSTLAVGECRGCCLGSVGVAG